MSQWQPQFPQSYAPQPPPRRSRKGWVAIACLGLLGLFILIGALGAKHSPSSSSAVPVTQVSQVAAIPAHSTAAAAPAHSTAAAKPVLAATFSGSGTQKTAQFTVTSNWALSYAFDCSSFGYKGNFQVFTDGGSDFNGVNVNDLATSKSAVTYAYGDAGTHYLEINSECSWTAKVYDEG